MPETPYETWTATRCDDGEWMVHTEGDIIAVGNNLTQEDAYLIAAAPQMRDALNRVEAAYRRGKLVSPNDIAFIGAVLAKSEGHS